MFELFATGDVQLQVALPISGLTMIGIAFSESSPAEFPTMFDVAAFERFRTVEVSCDRKELVREVQEVEYGID